jgi:DNA repair protein RadC
MENLPREILRESGVERLNEKELLSLVLGSGTRGKTVFELAQELLKDSSLQELSRKNVHELSQIKGLKSAKASQLIAIFELGRRLSQSRKEIRASIRNSEDVYNYLKEEFYGLSQEKVYVVFVDSKNRPLGHECFSEGGFDFSIIDLRVLFKSILNRNATGFFLLHNHPSGDSTPSQNDIEVTGEIYEIAQRMKLRFLDHIVVGEHYFSFADNGLM